MSQACQYGMHLKLKKPKWFKCSSLSVTKCLLSLRQLSCLWLCRKFILDIHHCHPSQGDNIFLHGLHGVAHITHLYIGWGGAGRVGVVSEGRWGEACLSESIWIFHCFQHFLLLVGRTEMSVNGCNVKCVSRILTPTPLHYYCHHCGLPQHALQRHRHSVLPLQCSSTDCIQYIKTLHVLIWSRNIIMYDKMTHLLYIFMLLL